MIETTQDQTMKVNSVTLTSRDLTQDELDGYWRFKFVEQCLSYIKTENRPVQFVVRGKSSGAYRLVKFSQSTSGGGEWEFSISGKGSWYTYKFSDAVNFLEACWEKSSVILPLDGEIQIEFWHPTANS